MRTLKTFGVALVAIFALAAVVSASASAASFLATKTGKLTGEKLQTQVFKTKGGTVECTTLKVSSGEVTELMTETQLATIKYENCTAYGIVKAEISPAEYLFMANGEVGIKKAITIKATGCEITVPAQTVSSVAYKNSGEGIEIVPSVTNIESSGTGITCTYSTEKEGTYKGTSFTELEGGKITWSSEG